MKVQLNRIAIYVPYFLATAVLSFLCVIAVAQVKFTTVVTDRQLSLNDYVQVEFTIEHAKSVANLSTPSFKNFRVVQGPIQSDGMSYVNGVMSQYKSVSFILQPLVTGTLTIPGATAQIDGKTMESEPVAVQVKNQGTAKRNMMPQPVMPSMFPREEPEVDEEYVLKPGESVADKIRNNILVKTDVNKTTCYEGEAIMATSVLCSRLKSESKVLKRPSLNGFSVYDMEDPESNTPTVRSINGRPFNVHLIRKTQLFPLQAGTYTIDPVELDNTVRFIRKGDKQAAPKNRMQQLMEELMNDGGVQGTMEEHSFTLASKPVTITVKPLPEANKPDGFNGAVGKFSIKSALKNNTVAAGDAAVLQVQIKGQGNFTVINAPALQLPKGMEVYDPVVKENVDKSVFPLGGTKTFEYTFTAKDTGTFTIPAIAFSYFDPSDARYKTTLSDSGTIRVLPSKKRHFFFNRPANGTIRGEYAHWIDAIPLNMLLLIIVIVFAGSIGIYQWRRSARRRVTKAPAPAVKAPVKPDAPKIAATDPLHQARGLMQDGKSQQFYSEVNKAVWEKLSERLQIPATELNKYNVVLQLQGKGVDPAVTQGLQAVLNECEIALYTPAHTFTDMQQTLHKAEDVLKALQLS